MGLWAKLTGNRATTASATAVAKKDSEKGNKYRGVCVVATGVEPCRAARAIAEERFLSEEAPTLPLADCDAEQCLCVYRHFDDRRSDVRRMADIGYSTATQFVIDEKRSLSSRGRRKGD